MSPLPFQQSQKFGTRNEQFAPQRPANTELSTLNKTVDAEIIDAKKIGCLLNRVGQTFGLRRLRGQRGRFHKIGINVPFACPLAVLSAEQVHTQLSKELIVESQNPSPLATSPARS